MAIIYNIGESLKLSAFNILQEPIKMLMDNESERFEKEGSKLGQIYTTLNLDKYQEEFRSRTSMDGFLPTEDMEKPGLRDFGEGFRKIFTSQIWTSSFVISKQTIEDNQTMDINTKAVGFIKSYYRTKELFGMKFIAGAVSSTDDAAEIYGKKWDITGNDTKDGSVDNPNAAHQKYFHNAHKSAGSTITFSNKFKTAAKVDLAAAGGVEKLVAVITAVEDKMADYRDEKGNLININPTKILIPGGQSLLRDAIEVGLKSKYGATMGGNGINPQYGKFEVVELPYLSGEAGFTVADQGFFLVDPVANKDYLGAVWINRKELEVDSYTDNGNKANYWDGRARFGAALNNPRAIAYVHTGGATGTTAGAIANAEEVTVNALGGGAVATKAI